MGGTHRLILNRMMALPNSWNQQLAHELQKPYFKELMDRVNSAYDINPNAVFPPKEDVLKAFQLCHWEALRVVILGQDPYPTKGHANGLCFSVAPDVRPLPKSLVNIFKEINLDLGLTPPANGDLSVWAEQGILLLNSVLTVAEGMPDSHKNWGWEQFTDAVIQHISTQKEQLVFILWGSKAQKKSSYIDPSKHLILKSVHPSPLAAHRGFFGCKHFSQTNAFLRSLGEREIQW